MKKRILLALLPAAMILTACAGIAPKEKNNLFLEDTLAHEEIFSAVEFNNAGFAPRRNLAPVENAEVPIGVQYSPVADGKVSMRFIAAIKVDGANLEAQKAALAHTTAVWTRSIYDKSGAKLLTERDSQIVSTKAYDEVNDGGATTNISSFSGYSFFVAYTMRNIPVSSASYLNVSLSIRDSENSLFNADSKIVAASIDGNTKFSYNASDNGFTLIKKTNAGFTSIANDANHEGNMASFTSDLSVSEGDSFLIANIWSSGFYVHGFNNKDTYNNDLLKDKVRFYNNGGSDFICSNYASTDLKIYLNNDAEIYINSGVNLTKNVYLNATNWDPAGAKLALYVFNASNNTEKAWFKFNQIGETNYYSTSISVPYSWFVNVIFCRYNKADTDPSWEPKNVYNQTGDLNLHTYIPSNLYTPTSWDGDNGNTGGTWSIYSAE